MKIGILTLPFNNNYGGYLQAYALMTVLKEMGHDVELIYRKHNRRPLSFRLKACIKNIIKFLLGRKPRLLLCNQEKELRIKGEYIMPFVDSRISPKTKSLYSTSELIKACRGKYDAIVVGSDQVWRPDYVPDIENFFLNFVDDAQTLKLSYAASFGTDNPNYSDIEKQKCGNLISLFDAVSVREESGIEVINKFDWSAKNKEVVLDPTMLVDIKKYQQFIKPVDEEYVVSYILDMNEDKQEMIESISKALSHPIKNLSIKGKKLPSMETWLSSLYHANFIITDSFHGTVFAILFNCPFIVWANKERGTDRFTSLLKQFGLERRIVFDKCCITELMNENIDWESVNYKLEINKNKSKAFLSRFLDKK